MDSTTNYIHKYIKLPSFPCKDTYLTKNDAIEDVRNIINTHSDDFRKDEEVIINYYEGETIVGVSAFLFIDKDGKFDLSVPINENETIKIIDSEDEPIDEDALWLTDDNSDETSEGTTKDEITSLYEEVAALRKLVEKHEYAFNNTMSSGDILVNSKKFELETSAIPIDPETGEEDDEDDGIEPDYSEYSEPNVHHITVKSVTKLSILKRYKDYLCENELIWCKGNESLYIYAKGSDDYLKLFKLNGTATTGGTDDEEVDTGNTIEYVYNSDTGILEINSDDTLISNDILNLDGTITSDNILLLNDGEKTLSVDLDETTNVLSVNGSGVSIDSDGYLNLSNVNLDSYILEI